jgi:hypothetical protein
VTKSDHEAKARAFVDNILKVNKQHGVDKASGVIKYDDAVKAVTKTFKRLREGAETTQGDHPQKRRPQNTKSRASGS